MQNGAENKLTRRDFVKATAAGTAAALAGSAGRLQSGQEGTLPRRMLGKTGKHVTVLGLGTAPAGFRPRKETARFYDTAISAGVTYMDTAPEFAGYGHAQLALGDVLRTRREEVFLVTKCWEPDGEKALALLKRNLAELQTDHADVVYAHSIGSDKMDLETVLGPRGVLRALEKARRDGLCRFVGISGHNRPDKFLAVLREFDVQVMMNAVSFVARHIYNFEELVWPVARGQDVGLVAMKVFGGMAGSGNSQKGARLTGDDCPLAFHYAMGLPGITTVVLGCYDEAELRQAIGWARGFQPLSDAESKRLTARGRELAGQWGEVYGPVA
ncbi:MAG: aldo/keto reductase [Pirellulales bacterium]